MIPTTRGVRAYSAAFARHFSGSQPPCCAVESSHDW